MDPIDRLGLVAARTRCPACSSASLDLRLRCDVDKSPCLITAQCESCRTTFVIDPTPDEVAVQASNCPQCGSQRHTLKLQCDVASHHCVEVEVCSRCRTVLTSTD